MALLDAVTKIKPVEKKLLGLTPIPMTDELRKQWEDDQSAFGITIRLSETFSLPN